MANITIRNLDAAAAQKLAEIAEKKNMSREEYIRRCLTSLSIIDEVREVEDRYQLLVRELADVIQLNTDTIARVNYLLDQNY